MDRQRILSLLITLCVMLSMIAMITSCGSKNEPAADDTTAETEEAEAEPDANAEQSASSTTMYVSAEDGLLLRKGPSKDQDVINLLVNGQEIQVDEMKDGWAHTTVDGKTGWCSMEFLTSDKSNIKTEEKTGSGAPDKLVEPTNTSNEGYHGYVDSEGGLNLRYGPGQDYNIITVIPDKTKLTELGWEEGWVYV